MGKFNEENIEVLYESNGNILRRYEPIVEKTDKAWIKAISEFNVEKVKSIWTSACMDEINTQLFTRCIKLNEIGESMVRSEVEKLVKVNVMLSDEIDDIVQQVLDKLKIMNVV